MAMVRSSERRPAQAHRSAAVGLLFSKLGAALVSDQFFGCLIGKFFGVFKGEAFFLPSVKNAVRISDVDVEAWHSARTRTGRYRSWSKRLSFVKQNAGRPRRRRGSDMHQDGISL